MLRHPLPLLCLLSLFGTAQAQTAPVITAADMPVPGDTLRLSLASPVLPATAPPLSRNGTNQTWNYAALQPLTQRVEAYKSVAASASGLQLVAFGPFGGANRATVATPRTFDFNGATLPVSDVKEFFNLSANDLRSVGFGVTFNGVALPVLYTAGPDVIYSLPLAFGASHTSNSVLVASVPGAGYLSQKRQRRNANDAWGTLTTPFGTFQTLRVVTTIIDHDSVAVGTGPGQGATLPTRREYKWLANGIHVPVLTITTIEVNGAQQVSAVEYRDVYRRPTALATRNRALDAGLRVYPNPSGVGTALQLAVPAGSGPFTVVATDVVGRQLFQRRFLGNEGVMSISAGAFGEFRGVLLLTVTTAQGTVTRRVVRE
ncbi:hypothetical protein BEN47_08925 [Hymenobacter lapidarius]|uniref:Secretion system C-terminal sorting domain-containing protein n=1 Tax=Hymenobacter lapidarius TaxID=1908237 RepID=A0A1G1TC57_9BACT|nr:T9SS type A sorting domain-containing protein [Hymenobacter lapidarius]OGX88451.1 hypothetical protein BEN47_08925 [Hymenobacter lapidarius]